MSTTRDRWTARGRRFWGSVSGGAVVLAVCCLFVSSVHAARSGRGGLLALSSPGNCPDPFSTVYWEVVGAASFPTVAYMILVMKAGHRPWWSSLAYVALTGVAARLAIEACSLCWGNTWGSGEILRGLFLPYLGRLAFWMFAGWLAIRAVNPSGSLRALEAVRNEGGEGSSDRHHEE